MGKIEMNLDIKLSKYKYQMKLLVLLRKNLSL